MPRLIVRLSVTWCYSPSRAQRTLAFIVSLQGVARRDITNRERGWLLARIALFKMACVEGLF